MSNNNLTSLALETNFRYFSQMQDKVTNIETSNALLFSNINQIEFFENISITLNHQNQYSKNFNLLLMKYQTKLNPKLSFEQLKKSSLK